MHSGPGHIVVVAHPDQVGIGELLIEQWIGECPVPVVGCPGAVNGIVLPGDGGKEPLSGCRECVKGQKSNGRY